MDISMDISMDIHIHSNPGYSRVSIVSFRFRVSVRVISDRRVSQYTMHVRYA